jgi:hypothetical protein
MMRLHAGEADVGLVGAGGALAPVGRRGGQRRHRKQQTHAKQQST